MADADTEQATYSDDEFASDGGYEDEYEDQSGNASEMLASDLAAHVNDNKSAKVPVDAKETGVVDSHEHSETTARELDQEVAQAKALGQSESVGRIEPALDATEQLSPAAALTDGRDNKSSDSNETVTVYDSTEAQATEQVPVETEQIQTRDESTTIPSASDDSISNGTSSTNLQAPSPHVPPRIGQQPRPGTFRSLSTPVVPALSLGDPHALASRYTRSTSVPSVVTSDASELQSLGRFPIESIPSSLSSARVKSFQRLPSVVEIQAPGGTDAGTEGDADDDESENDESDDSSRSGSNVPVASFTVSTVQRGRSSSIQMSPPTLMISPVTRANSQPFMTRLPSVIELTAEESAAIESMRNSDNESEDDDKNDDRSDPEDSDTEDLEHANTPPIDLITPPPSIVPVSTSAVGSAVDTGPAAALSKTSNGELSRLDADPAAHQPDASDLDAEEERDETSPAEDMEALVLVSHETNELEHDQTGSSDEYDDEYDEPGDSDVSEQSQELARATSSTEQDEETDETDAIPDSTTSRSPEELKYTDNNGDDAFGGDEDGEDVFDLGFEEENRRETESLLREAHLLLQKQHEDESKGVASSTQTNDALAVVEERDNRDSVEVLALARTNAVSVGDTAFDDHYGGEDFANSDEDEEKQDEFDPYASDSDNAVARDGSEGARANASQDVGSAEQMTSTSPLAPVSSAGDHESSGESSSAAVSSPDAASGVDAPSEATREENPLTSPVSNADQPSPPRSLATESTETLSADPDDRNVESEPNARSKASPVEQQPPVKATRPDSTKVAARPPAARPTRPALVVATNSTTSRISRPTRSVPERVKVESLSEPKRERPRELRLRTERAGRQTVAADVRSHASPPPSSAASSPRFQSPRALSRPSSEHRHVHSLDAPSSVPEPSATPTAHTSATEESPVSPTSDARRSPERVPTVYMPRVYIESYELPPRKAPVFKQPPRVKKPRADDARRKLLLPVKSPPNLRIELPAMGKTKRNWLLLNMFRHGDDVSKYESFVPQLATSSAPSQSAQRPARPSSAALQQTYASSQADAIAAYRGSRSSRNGRKLVQQDPVLRERERNWMAIKPHESAIPAYDSILDKFCTTVTSPVVQRQIYETRHDDLSPQLAYVLERRVERQWKSDIAEAFGAPSASYKADVVSPRGMQ